MKLDTGQHLELTPLSLFILIRCSSSPSTFQRQIRTFDVIEYMFQFRGGDDEPECREAS